MDNGEKLAVKPTWGLAWGLWWRIFLISLGLYAIIFGIMFLVLGVTAIPFMGTF